MRGERGLVFRIGVPMIPWRKLLVCMVFAGLLSACEVPPSFIRPPPPPQPLTMPPADGRAHIIVPGDGFRYVVNQQGLEQARGNVVLRVARVSAPELTYSDGLIAKKIAQAYCAEFNRVVNASAFGMFSAPSSWLFEGGCV